MEKGEWMIENALRRQSLLHNIIMEIICARRFKLQIIQNYNSVARVKFLLNSCFIVKCLPKFSHYK